MSQKISLSSDAIGQKLAEQTFRDMGLDLKSGEFPNGGEMTSASSPNPSYPTPVSSYHIKVPKTPFRIKTIEKTRYQSPTGTTYRYSALYRNAVALQLLVEKWTSGLDPRKHYRLIAQVNDAARSMIANIAEGYARPTTKEYLLRKLPQTSSTHETQVSFLPAQDQTLQPLGSYSSPRHPLLAPPIPLLFPLMIL